jgi:hypothetical protein
MIEAESLASSNKGSKATRFQFSLWHVLVVIMALCALLAAIVQMDRQFVSELIGTLAFTFCALIGFGRKNLILGCAGVIGLTWCLLVSYLPGLLHYDHGPAYRRVECINNLKHITLALQNYHDAHGTFPPAYFADKNGRPMHSWRVLILPFMDEGKLYDQYDFNEPWDGPNNSKLAAKIPRVFQCPSNYGREQSQMTSYVVVVGPETAWPGEKATKLADMTDGSSNTILVVEVADSGIHWMEPRDFHVLQMSTAVNATSGQGISSKHPGIAHVSLADGSTRSVSQDWSPQTLKALLTINGGETIDWDAGDATVVVKNK